MGKKVRVALFGEQRRSAKIDLQATEGATVGTSLYWADGSLVTDAQIRNTSGTSTSSSSGTVTGSGATVTLWQLIIGIPAIVSALVALATNGLLVRTGTGTLAVRTIGALDERITVTNGDGVAGNPTIGMSDWPYVKNSVATGESVTIPSGYQLIVHDTFLVTGDITVDGDLVIL